MEDMRNSEFPPHSSDSGKASYGGRKRKCNAEEESSAKKSRTEEKSLSKNSPPKQDFIHVRARRGQATDSHSLAERVRREKISQRMKFLQDLVPGCNKVTGKAVMLDEIINYVQSLQRQVEFLSMKLATVNPHLDLNIEHLLSKEMIQGTSSMLEPGIPFEFRASTGLPFSPPPPLHYSVPNLVLNNSLQGQFSLNPIDCFPQEHSQLGPLWDEDLHAFGQTAFDQSAEAFHGLFPSDQMKIEL